MYRALIVVGVMALTRVAAAADLSQVTASDYYAAAYFKGALENPKIAKLGRSAQINAVAHDLKLKPKNLKDAIEKVEALCGEPEEIGKVAEKAIKGGAAGTRVKDRLLDVLLNIDEPKHVVAYVRWRASGSKEVVKEAEAIASLIAETAPLVSTLSLAAIHPKAGDDSKDAVWSGKISSASMKKIQKSRIDDYGDRLYKGLFEGVEEKTF
jgi:hypothetical protein